MITKYNTLIKKFLGELDTVRGLQIFKLLRFSFIILIRVLLAKTYLSLAEIGLFDTLMLISGTFTFFWMAGLLDGLLSAYPKFKSTEQPIFLFNVFLLFLGLGGIVALGLWYFQPYVVQLMTNYPTSTLPYFDLLCLFLAINIPTYLIEMIYLLKKEPHNIIFFGLYAFMGQLIVVTVPLFLGYSLLYSFWGLIGLAFTKLIWLILVLKKHTVWTIRLPLLQPYLVLALPLGLYFFTGSIMDYVDKVLVSRLFDTAHLAIYETGAKEFPISLALISALASALLPVMAENLEDGLQQIKKRSIKLMHLLFISSILLMFVSPYLFPIVFNAEFKASAWIFNIYLLILLSRILLPQVILIGLKKTHIILYASLVEVSVNLGLSLVLVQFYGLYGIATATVIAFMVERLLLIGYNQFYLKIPLQHYLNVRLYLVYAVFLVGSFWWVMF